MSRPFDKAKYKVLSEGLEISEVEWSSMNEDIRFDAEYFRKRFLREETNLRKFSRHTLAEVAFVSDGQHGYFETDAASPIHMLAARNAKQWFADQEDAVPIAKWVDDKNQRSSLRENDIILSTRGTVGCCAIVGKDVLPANINQDVARLAIHHPDFLPEFVLAYLNSSYGQDWLQRNQTGMVQQGVCLQKLRNMPIPCLSSDFQASIATHLHKTRDIIDASHATISSAETLLLAALGLEHWQPPNPLAYICSSTHVFDSGRMDSQYFAPRVIQLLDKLGKDGITIRDVAPPRLRKFMPGTIGSFRYIEISDIQSNGTITDETIEMADAPSRATWYVEAGDVLTSTVRPNRRLSAIVAAEQDGCIASSGFVVLQPKHVAPEVLLTYLRLPHFCELMDLHTSASLYPTISDKDLLSLPFPKVAPEVSQTIVEAVRAAHQMRRRAKTLLELAKRAVETAIEQGEDAGMRLLAEGRAFA